MQVSGTGLVLGSGSGSGDSGQVVQVLHTGLILEAGAASLRAKSAGRNGRCSPPKLDAGGEPASPLALFEACSAFQKRLRQLVNLSEGSTL